MAIQQNNGVLESKGYEHEIGFSPSSSDRYLARFLNSFRVTLTLSTGL